MEKVVNLNKSYQGKKVFLTGHTGFKGTWLLTWLHAMGADVKGYSLAPDKDHPLYDQVNGSSMCQSVFADIRDRSSLKKEIIEFEPDYIFHLAAQPIVRISYDEPVETFNANVMGTAHVLDSLRFFKKKCSVVIVTTDKVYENLETERPYVETDPLGGYDPYSASKAASEMVVSSYRRSFFSADPNKLIASARAGNVIGGGDWAPHRIIPDVVRAFSKGEKVMVRNPIAIRPWQHVLEPLGGYLLLGAMLYEDAALASSWNFGPQPNDVLTVREIVEQVLRHWKGGVDFASAPSGPHEAGILKLDIQKAQKQLGWNPKFNTAEAIRHTIEWYKNVLVNKEDPRSQVMQQINAYQA